MQLNGHIMIHALTSVPFHGLDEVLSPAYVLLGGREQTLIVPELEGVGERYDVEHVTLSEIAQDGVEGILGLSELISGHGATDVQDEEHILVDRGQPGWGEVVDKVAIYNLHT